MVLFSALNQILRKIRKKPMKKMTVSVKIKWVINNSKLSQNSTKIRVYLFFRRRICCWLAVDRLHSRVTLGSRMAEQPLSGDKKHLANHEILWEDSHHLHCCFIGLKITWPNLNSKKKKCIILPQGDRTQESMKTHVPQSHPTQQRPCQHSIKRMSLPFAICF